ncbi:MAG: tetratricopeptide repeat protein [Anaerolineales bacterium]|nr:tetratricopeptide repeat protein [Anaerolineales bacterium]
MELHLLGGLAIHHQGQPLPGFVSRKAEALLAYLAYTGGEHTRLALADLFWDDRTSAQALGNLRVILSNLRQVAGSHLEITRHSVAWQPDSAATVDALELTAALAVGERALTQAASLTRAGAQALEAALSLYQGDFLAGVYLKDAGSFEEWALLEREQLRRRVIGAFDSLTSFYLKCGEYAPGGRAARRLLALDPLREESHRLLMQLLARSGQLPAALDQYAACRALLAAELGVEPAPATRALYERLQAAGRAYRHNLPAQAAPLVGRETEAAALAANLLDPACRLLTLTGPGGIGKTRLALHAAAERLGGFLDGVYFVPLAPLADTAGLVAVLAEALQFAFSGRADPRTQLLDYLRGKEALLVLDNFEHLLDRGAALVADLLAAAPDVKLLVTSRERLNLRGEWLYEVRGLPAPEAEVSAAAAPAFGAVQLFVQCARRVQPEFQLTAANTSAVVAITRLLDGLPLGLELAAAWLRLLSPAEVAAELERGLAFLSATVRDAPERHRSLRAVFDYTWRTLLPPEQAVFRRLCVLRGGFSRPAAEAVAADGPAVLPLLAALTDKSLLTCLPSGRYLLHEHLRHFGLAQLEAAGAEYAPARDRHSAYYAAFLALAHQRLRGPEQAATLYEIGLEFENLRAAWHWAMTRRQVTALAQSLDGLSLFCHTRGRYAEAAALFAAAAEAFAAADADPAERRLLGRLLIHQARCQEYLWDHAGAAQGYQRGLDLLAVDQPAEAAQARHGLGSLALQRGALAEAEAHLAAALGPAEAAGNRWLAAAVLNTRAQVAERQGRYAQARRWCEQGLGLRRALGDGLGLSASLNYLGLILTKLGTYAEAMPVLDEAWQLATDLNYRIGLANVLTNRANAAYYLGDRALAERSTRASLEVCRDIGDAWGEAIALNNLGYMAVEDQAFEQARRLYSESLAIYRRTGIQSGLASTLANLGLACLEAGAPDEASAYLREALERAHAGGARPVALKALLGWARWLAHGEQAGLSQALLQLVAHHPAAEEANRAAARRLLGAAAAPPPAPEADLDAALAAAIGQVLAA